MAASSPYTMAPPVGGLNARDSEALMPETDALVLDNWFPDSTSVDVRKGYSSFATFTGDCESIILYHGASDLVFVGVDTTDNLIINATSGGAISTAVVGGSGPAVQSLTNVRFDYVNFANTSGQYALLVNGADTPLQFDGTTWSASGLSGTGLTVTDIHTLGVYGERIWLAGSGFDVWYLATDAIAGTATRLNLGSLFTKGGSLSSIVPWSADSSSDLADYIGFLSTEGEMVIYTGDDPSQASTWARVATVNIGKPVTSGQRAFTRLGSDTAILTVDGLVPLSQVIIGGRVNPNFVPISDKIRNKFNSDVKMFSANYGWDVIVHSSGKKLLVNVPNEAGASAYQYVMNIETTSWSRFTGWMAFCMAASKDTLYWGGSGVLAKADTGTTDAGSSIDAEAKQAFSYFGIRGLQKDMKMVRPILRLDGPVDLRIGVNVDYQDSPPTSIVPVSGNAGDPWDTSWDVAWTGAAVVLRKWQGARGIGVAISPRLTVQSDGINLSWFATDFLYETGGVL